MSDRYLWDRTGEPDREIAELEEVLAPLRLRPPATVAAAKPRRRRGARLALAAASALAAALLIWALGRPAPPMVPGPMVVAEAEPATAPPATGSPVPWTVAPLEGAPRLAEVALQEAEVASSGAVVETDARSRVRISMGNIGQVELDGGTRVRLVSAGYGRHRLGLDRGVLHALIWAPAGRFDVETPAGVVTDLGCAYTLAVDDRGAGHVTVSSGWVGFDYRGRESLIPAGASARLKEGLGPGTPTVPGSARDLRQLVAAVDGGMIDGGAAIGARHLRAALARARRADAVTLWHLLARVPDPWRGAVHDRLSELAPPPPGVERARIVAGDPEMRDRWWDVLGHGPIADWRRWKATASPLR